MVLVQVPGSPVPIPVPVPDVTPLSPPLGAKQPVPLKVSPLRGFGKYNPVQAAAIGLARAAADANVVSGQGTLDVNRYGAVLNARTMLTVRGAGITFDGQYFVESVTHTVKPGAYKQSFTLTRNALIAGNGPVADIGSYLASPVQQLAGLASAAAAAPPAVAGALAAAAGPAGSPASHGAAAGPLPASPAP